LNIASDNKQIVVKLFVFYPRFFRSNRHCWCKKKQFEVNVFGL